MEAEVGDTDRGASQEAGSGDSREKSQTFLQASGSDCSLLWRPLCGAPPSLPRSVPIPCILPCFPSPVCSLEPPAPGFFLSFFFCYQDGTHYLLLVSRHFASELNPRPFQVSFYGHQPGCALPATSVLLPTDLGTSERTGT